MIEVKHLTKKYGTHTAVNNLSFNVEEGKIYGFLGPNGAGKSTTMNIITGCLAATEGQVIINGNDIFEQPLAAKKSIGYLPEQPPVYPEMTPYEYLKFVAEAKKVPRSELEDQLTYVMETTQITDVSERLIKNLSKGYRQRVGIAQAMIGNPDVIILDEPTVGLDPKQIIEIRDLIHSLGQKHTVILSSHILTEISAVCDYVIIIAHGKMIASDTLENLSTHYTGKSTMMLTIKGDENKIKMALNDIDEIQEYEIETSDLNEGLCSIKIQIDREADIREKLFFAFSDIKLPILSMITESLSLEDVFLRLTRKADEDYEAAKALEEAEDEERIIKHDDNDSNENNDDGDEDNKNKDDEGYTSIFGSRKDDDK